jgi:hypothetical protein
MTDSTSKLSATAKAERRIAAMHAVRTPVDSQGTPTGPPATYTYDEDGQLVSAVPGKATPPATRPGGKRYGSHGRVVPDDNPAA